MKQNMITIFIRTIGIFCFYIAVFLYAIIFNNSTGWLLLFFLTFLLLCDLFTLFLSLKKIQVQSTESKFYAVNQPNQIKVVLFRYRPTLLRLPILTLWIKDTTQAKKQFLTLYSGRKKELTLDWQPTQRGVFQQLPLVFICSDLFGLFSKRSILNLAGPFVVMPILQLDLAERLYQQLLVAQPTFSKDFGCPSFSIRNFRDYQIGDSFHSIDWKQSGKRNELIVKEYEQETETGTHFLFYGLSHENFEQLLSVYYSFIQVVENKLSFQQTIMADFPNSTPKDHVLAAIDPLLEEMSLPTVSNKKLVVFSPTKTNWLDEQLYVLNRNNDLYLVTFEGADLCLYWKDQVFFIDKGGQPFED
ncbi:DUF58 domain-containing protein [Candidatus Enterococcus ikei]|uniref:DUF58 domain-containing protein n=1 Tax=Candidatus Enterococcus ikei TaxID=2815326 RepID=A0ABS3H124_9ENTE|nr:DUF58 domain-containing protein [Enterococcus sp. DIV0869a]MBO0440750.1 DUF58 domain-containing protein [Enterococcus sp. DIV0869a]